MPRGDQHSKQRQLILKFGAFSIKMFIEMLILILESTKCMAVKSKLNQHTKNVQMPYRQHRSDDIFMNIAVQIPHLSSLGYFCNSQY